MNLIAENFLTYKQQLTPSVYDWMKYLEKSQSYVEDEESTMVFSVVSLFSKIKKLTFKLNCSSKDIITKGIK